MSNRTYRVLFAGIMLPGMTIGFICRMFTLAFIAGQLVAEKFVKWI